MSKCDNLFLVGPMGAGKTTIGRLLAAELGLSFKDSDKEIEQRCGADIPWIFDMEGEQGFRNRELAMIDELTQMHSILLATGGGVVLQEANRQYLSQRGTVVYLKTSVAQQLGRTQRDKNRPLLQCEDPEQKLIELQRQREPLYLEVADIIVSTDQGNTRSVSQEVMQQLPNLGFNMPK